MPPDESVSASLIHPVDLPEAGFVVVDTVISGENASILLDCNQNPPRAWLNSCPHQGRRLDYAPGKFLMDKGRLVCAAHGAIFEMADGGCIAGPCRGEHLREVAVTVAESGALELGDWKAQP